MNRRGREGRKGFWELVLGLSFASIALFALHPRVAGAEDVPVTVNGKDAGTVYVYRVGTQRWFDARQAAGFYGGRFVWQAVSGKIQLSVRGRLAQLTIDSAHARVVDTGFDLPGKVLVRANTVLIPVEFFSSPAFSEISWMKTRLDPEKGLQIDPKSSVGPMRWFSHKDHTRVVVELDSVHTYSVSRRGRSSMDVTIPLGTIESPRDVDLKDGIVDAVRLRQEPKLARLSIDFAEDAPKAAWDARTFPDPQRLVIDVYRDAQAMARAGKKSPPEPVRGDAAPVEEEEPTPTSGVGAAPTPTVPGTPVAVPGTPSASQAPRGGSDHVAVPGTPSASQAPRGGSDHVAVPGTPSASQAPRGSLPIRRIVVDPGHGGRDAGATGHRGVREKDINLSAAKELAKLLRGDGSFDVLLTRDSDVFVPLAERSRIANDFGADLFVSLHCNANRHRSEKGFEIYFLSERASDPEAARVAEMENASLALEGGGSEPDAEAAVLLHALARTEFINDASMAAGFLSKALARKTSLPGRGVKQAAFYVLRGTSAPAVLVEMGFVSNSGEEAKLDTKSFRHKVVEGIYSGIRDFAKRQDRGASSK